MDNLYGSLEKQYGLPEGALSAIQGAENSGDQAVSPKGATGRFQFMPATAKAYNVDVNDPISSAEGAAKYLSDLTKHYGSFQAAVAHYNGGTSQAKAVLAGSEPTYKETKNYLQKVKYSMPQINPDEVEYDGKPASVKINPSEVIIDEPISAKEVTKDLPAQFANMSKSQQALEGFKKSFRDIGLGARQVIDPLAVAIEEKLPLVKQLEEKYGYKTAEQTAKETPELIKKEREQYAPLMETTPGMLGNVAGQVAQQALGGGLIKGAGAMGAVSGALQPTLPEESRAFNTIAGGALGKAGEAVTSGISRIGQPIQEALEPRLKQAVDVLRKAGIPLDAAQATGSALLTRAKTILDTNPLTAGFEQKAAAEQQSAFNKAVLEKIGANANSATSDVMGAAAKRINGVFKNILDNNNVKLTDKSVANIAKIQEAANDSEVTAVGKIADRIVKNVQSDGTIPGQTAYEIKTNLDRLASSADSTTAYHARQLRTELLDTINNSLSDVDREAFSTARNQFRNMKTIEGAIDKEGGGNISPARLANVMGQKANRGASIYGRGNQDLVELAQAGNMLLKDKTPNSGTIARGAALLLPGVVSSAATGLYTGDLQQAGEAGLAGVVAPKIFQKALRSQYLEQGLKNQAIKDMLNLPKKAQLGKIAPGSFNAYLQSIQPQEK